MLFKNAYIFTEEGVFTHGSFRVEDGKFTEIHRNILPELLRLGVSQEDIDRMLIDNPRNFFEGN
jgi:predicted metal-dependent phosphotriesterase family hydrolase